MWDQWIFTYLPNSQRELEGISSADLLKRQGRQISNGNRPIP